jgi:hypothetical protein
VYLTEEQMTYLFAGAALMSVLFGLAAVFAPRVCGGKDSWLADVLKADCPLTRGFQILQGAAGATLVVAAVAVPTVYYQTARMEQEVEAMRQGYEKHYLPGSDGVHVWRKAGSPTP